MAHATYKIVKGSIEEHKDYTSMKVSFNGKSPEYWEARGLGADGVRAQLEATAEVDLAAASKEDPKPEVQKEVVPLVEGVEVSVGEEAPVGEEEPKPKQAKRAVKGKEEHED